jgi:hypothetical protein
MLTNFGLDARQKQFTWTYSNPGQSSFYNAEIMGKLTGEWSVAGVCGFRKAYLSGISGNLGIGVLNLTDWVCTVN